MRNCVLRAEENAFNVNRLHFVPFLFCQFVGRFVGAGYAGVVHQYVELAEFFRNVIDSLFYLGFVCYIAMPIGHFVTLGGQFRGECFTGLVKDIQYANCCALLHHTVNRSLANANGSSSHCCYLACQSCHVIHSSLRLFC